MDKQFLIEKINEGYILEQKYFFFDDIQTFTLIDISLPKKDDIEISKEEWNFLIEKYPFITNEEEHKNFIRKTYFFNHEY